MIPLFAFSMGFLIHPHYYPVEILLKQLLLELPPSLIVFLLYFFLVFSSYY